MNQRFQKIITVCNPNFELREQASNHNFTLPDGLLIIYGSDNNKNKKQKIRGLAAELEIRVSNGNKFYLRKM